VIMDTGMGTAKALPWRCGDLHDTGLDRLALALMYALM